MYLLCWPFSWHPLVFCRVLDHCALHAVFARVFYLPRKQLVMLAALLWRLNMAARIAPFWLNIPARLPPCTCLRRLPNGAAGAPGGCPVCQQHLRPFLARSFAVCHGFARSFPQLARYCALFIRSTSEYFPRSWFLGLVAASWVTITRALRGIMKWSALAFSWHRGG